MTESQRVGVLRGGAYPRAPEYDVSLATGNLVLRSLAETGHKPVDLFVDRAGLWHLQGLPATTSRIKENVDLVWNALHGPFALGGAAEEKLKELGMPYTGPVWQEAAFPISRNALNHRLRGLGFKTPYSVAIESDAIAGAKEVFAKISPPWLVRPPVLTEAGSVYLAKDLNELVAALELQLKEYGSAYVEEAIAGERATGGVIEHFRDETWYRLIPQGNLKSEEKRMIEDLSEKLHLKMGLRHYSQFDFVVSPRRGVYVVDVCPLPRLDGAFGELLGGVGASLPDFVVHVIKLAREY
jgi:D-alanine-D-alanine ligase-like ATP-grasp enzyme